MENNKRLFQFNHCVPNRTRDFGPQPSDSRCTDTACTACTGGTERETHPLNHKYFVTTSSCLQRKVVSLVVHRWTRERHLDELNLGERPRVKKERSADTSEERRAHGRC